MPRMRLIRVSPLFALLLMGCPKDREEGAAQPELGGTPEAAVKACHDFVSHAAAMMQRTCDANETLEELEAELESQFESSYGDGGCEGADGLRDEMSFYEACLPGLDTMEDCLADREAALPEACGDQLQFIAE
jgi:hypothetical protein